MAENEDMLLELGLSAAKRPRADEAQTGTGGAASSATQAGGEPPQQQRRANGKAKAKPRKEDMEVLLQQVAKLSLVNARGLAEVRSVLTMVVVFSKEEPLGKEVTQAVKNCMLAYMKESKESSAEDRASMMPPHVFAWYELTKVVQAKAIGESWPVAVEIKKYYQYVAEESTKMVTSKQAKDATEAGRVVMYNEVKVAKVTKCYAPNLSRLEVAAEGRARELLTHIISALCLYSKGQAKRGAAPKSDLERRIARVLDRTTDE
eukprot:TRINITY_DN18592_c0_g1_i2.p1 TRINITY_DN18592_c0_g1~~TRINITY_DN18592_c0_g1_i2.p1  ORF type:complete len:262 (-),score=97.93 TRINITY_DN18592_c0_g1_i2:749-1534(-)